MISTSFILASLASLAVATTISPQVLHERRTSTPDGWVKRSRHASDAVLPLRFGLAQSNMDKIDQYLLDVSDPDSPNYGNHWSAADVAKTFAPSQETVDVVSDWLKTSGVHPERIKVAPGKIWLELNATVAEAEKLLSTQYNVYEHASGAAHVGCDSYHVPAHVARHIEVVTPSVSFDRRLVGRDGPGRPKAAAIGQPGAGVAFPKDAGVIHNLIDQLENCDSHITPLCLRALYGIVYEPLAAHKNSYGIVEYTPQAYLQEDLDLFFTNFSKSTVGTKPKLVSIDGGVAQTTDKGFATNGESDLDIEYGQVLVTKKLPITLYQVGDLVQGASFNNLLDALDGSYCTFEGGDDPTQDGIYPDPFGTAEDGAYQGNDCGKYKPAYTISTSYAYDEADLSPAYAARQCAEYAKLGLMGTTVVYSSGDNGVAGNQDVCLEDDGTQSPTGKRFNPSFPGTCPYITSIGATQLPAGKKIGDPESATYEVIFSGGGFSNYFARPAYQSAQVSAYLKNYTPTYSTPTTYNNTGRGFPDISANGANYVVAVDGGFSRVFGTSASAPVVGAMLTNINDARLAIGKKPLGFINPALYSPSFKSAYNDITNGTNPGCGTEGFNATKGWDPVTGLGTPRFPILLAKFLAI